MLLASRIEFARSRIASDNSNVYEVFGTFALALSSQGVVDPLSEAGVREGFKLLNEIAARADADTIELLRTAVFEVLCDTAAGIKGARSQLVDGARKVFEEVAEDYDAPGPFSKGG